MLDNFAEEIKQTVNNNILEYQIVSTTEKIGYTFFFGWFIVEYL